MDINKSWKILKGQSKKDNPDKLATWGTQVEEKQNNTHNTIQYVLNTTICQANTNKKKIEPL
jgi:hypothetical protein